MTLVAEAMNHEVVTAAPDVRAEEALELATRADADHVLVMDGEDLVGIAGADELAAAGPGATTADAMTPVSLVVRPDAAIEDAVATMADRHVRWVPVALGGLVLGTLSGAAARTGRPHAQRGARRGNMPHA